MYLEYKGFFADVKYYENLDMWIGCLENIDDYVNFEAESVEMIEEEFHKAVDGYLELRREISKNTDFDKIKNPKIFKFCESEKCFVIETVEKPIKVVFDNYEIVEKSDGTFEFRETYLIPKEAAKELIDRLLSNTKEDEEYND